MNALQIEACLEIILEAAGSSLRHYGPYTKDKLREAMRTVEGIVLVANGERKIEEAKE
jgi:hypothetical protein